MDLRHERVNLVCIISLEALPGPLPTSKEREGFAIIVNSQKPLTIAANLSIFDVGGGPFYASACKLTKYRKFGLPVHSLNVYARLCRQKTKSFLPVYFA